MILFLDFDGTLHPNWEFYTNARDHLRARPYEGPKLVAAPLLAALLRPLGDQVDVVISSTWAHSRPLDEIRALLPNDLGTRVIDSIWLPELTTGTWSEYHSKQATRHACIRLWLKRRRPDYEGPWLALDDEGDAWPEADRGHLVHAAGTLCQLSVQRDLAHHLIECLGATVPLSTLLDTITILDRLLVFFEQDVGAAIRWYQEHPLDELGSLPAEQLVGYGRGSGVLQYLDNLAAGATG